jgi:hypothetical protein
LLTPFAEVLGCRVGEIKHSVCADETATGFAVRGLSSGPLGLAHSGLAGVRAVCTFGTSLARDGCASAVGVLNAGPSSEAEIVDGHNTLLI